MLPPLRLGLCIPKGKKSRIGFPGRIWKLCADANIEIVEIDINKDINSQGPFHFLLHKVLDFYNECEFMDDAKAKIDKLVAYTVLHPEMVVLDDIQWCWRLTNRKLMTELIRTCTFSMNGTHVFLPKTINVTEKMTFSAIKQEIGDRKMKFPVLIKSYSAYFDDGAHVMALVFSMDGLKKINKPYLIQEFCNHSGVCYKVFVVGDKFNICERPSIKDLDDSQLNCSTQTIFFDSFRVSKTGHAYHEDLHDSDPNKRHWYSCDEIPDLLDTKVLRELVTRIHTLTGLYLYGFDILIEKGTNNYAFIDINQFPSYKGIGEMHLPTNLVDLLKSFPRGCLELKTTDS